jgi:nucleoside-diphosphate-sugar epimerase
VLRPGNVYGPYSRTFSIRPIQYLKKGNLLLVGSADTPSNTVYVDNLVHAIVRGLDAPAEQACGQVFTISDGDEMTWGEFYGYFANSLGATLRTAPLDVEASKPRGSGPFGWVGSWWRSSVDVLRSPEFRSFGKRILNGHPIGKLPRWMLERFPSLDSRVRRMVGTEAVMIYRRSAGAGPDVMKVRPRKGLIRSKSARQGLGYEPPVSRKEALELTLGWIREARLG